MKRYISIIVIAISGFYSFSVIAGENKTIPAEVTQAQQQWEGYLDLLKNTGNLQQNPMVHAAPDLLPRYLFMTLAHAYNIVTRTDPDFPEFVPYINHVFNIAGPNPDTTYWFTSIDSSNTYRIYGQRNTVHMIDFQLGYDYFGFREKLGKVLHKRTIEDFVIDEDGSFEILVGTQKPDGYDGNWLQIDKKVDFILLRQVAYHPSEVNARMAIEKIAGEPTPPRYADTDTEIKALIDYTRNNASLFLGIVGKLVEEDVYNRFDIPNWASEGGATGQVYQHGLYKIAKDEAFVVKLKVPGQCRYWNIQATDMLWQTHDFYRSQSILNGHIDRADKDGLTRIVLSHSDPGVRNWIDLNGFEEGYILIRWVGCGAGEDTVATKMPISELGSYLPKDTERVTAAQRLQQLRDAVSARQFRRYW